jgi:hypothetical protein
MHLGSLDSIYEKLDVIFSSLARSLMLSGRNRLAVHGITTARWAVSAVLLAVAIMLSCQLLAPLIHRTQGTQTDAQTAMARVSPARPRAVLIADIQDAHIFGDADASPATAPVVTSDGSVTVTGIIYSTEEQDSVALLSVAGNAVVSHVGTQLATGQTVTGIQSDRVVLRGRDGLTSLLLDIKQADLDQRMSPSQFAVVSGTDGNSGIPMMPSAFLAPSTQGAPTAPVAHVTLVPTHYVALKSLRGRSAAARVANLDAPVISSTTHH